MMAAKHMTGLELAEKVDKLEATVAGLAARIILMEQRLAGELVTDQPEECLKRTCDYYQHYLAQGPKELEHEGYHAAERQCREWQERDIEHQKVCHSKNRAGCETCHQLERQCRLWEGRVRA